MANSKLGTQRTVSLLTFGGKNCTLKQFNCCQKSINLFETNLGNFEDFVAEIGGNSDYYNKACQDAQFLEEINVALAKHGSTSSLVIPSPPHMCTHVHTNTA